MAGLAGVLFLDRRPFPAEFLSRMIAAALGDGPDGVGTWSDSHMGLVRFKTATTPEAVHETQPFQDPKTGDCIVFDGRLDNRADLLERLGGSVSASAPDCEIAIALNARFGDAFVSMLTGDYALAIWRASARRLFCARSPLGWRPFLWTVNERFFAFASQPRVLIEGLGLERALNEGAIGEYLSARFVSLTDTFWKGVQRLPGGSALAVEDGRLRSWHWHKPRTLDGTHRSEADHVEEFRGLFDQALEASMRSSTEVAAQLSGGLDSTSVVCRGVELYRAGRIARPPRAVSVRFPGEAHDESQWSSAAERHLGIAADVVLDRPYDLDAARQWCRDTLHLPLRPNVMMPVCERLAAQGVRVLLTGEGGDDWMAGSRAHWPDLVRRGRWLQLYREAISLRSDRPLKTRLRQAIGRGVLPLISASRSLQARWPQFAAFDATPPPWIRPEWAARIGLAERWRNDRPTVAFDDYASRFRYQVYDTGRRHVNWDNVLAHADRCNVEIRHPLHDLRISHFAMGADGQYFLRGDETKHLLRLAMRGTLPEKVRTRRGKANFTPIILGALQQRLRERDIGELLPVRMGWVDDRPLRAMYREHAAWWAGDRETPMPQSHFGAIWFVAAMDMWLEHAFGA